MLAAAMALTWCPWLPRSGVGATVVMSPASPVILLQTWEDYTLRNQSGTPQGAFKVPTPRSPLNPQELC